MADREFHYDLNEFETNSHTRRWWPRALAVSVYLGAVYGSAVGSAISTTALGIYTICFAAGIMALRCGVYGARYGFLFGMSPLRDRILNRVRFGRLFIGTGAAIVGAILGGLLGIMTAMPLGALLGAVGGWLFVQAILRRFLLKRPLDRFMGVALGGCIGAMSAALQKDQSAALVGIAWGVGIGAVVGPLLLLLFIGTLRSLPHTHDNDRGNWFDATFRR